jgi:hypothetical protein
MIHILGSTCRLRLNSPPVSTGRRLEFSNQNLRFWQPGHPSSGDSDAVNHGSAVSSTTQRSHSRQLMPAGMAMNSGIAGTGPSAAYSRVSSTPTMG